jgi:hypothetical protein
VSDLARKAWRHRWDVYAVALSLFGIGYAVYLLVTRWP